jgi:hypothetical protein
MLCYLLLQLLARKSSGNIPNQLQVQLGRVGLC